MPAQGSNMKLHVTKTSRILVLMTAVAGLFLVTAGTANAAGACSSASIEESFVLPDGSYAQAPAPADVSSAADGRFRAFGLAPGEAPVIVRADGFALWRGSCVVEANATAALRVSLTAGVTCVGSIRDDNGDPLPGIEVGSGRWGTLEHYRTMTAADGTFARRGVPADRRLGAGHRSLG